MSDSISPLMQLIRWLTGRPGETQAAVAQTATPSFPFVAPLAAEHAFSAPYSGSLVPLEDVPDPAFANRLVGEGVAIRPSSGLLTAPCEGEVLTVAATGHALSMRGPGGAEVLFHIGIGTVAMKGKGFEPLVKVGQKVRVGDSLIRFDLAAVAREAESPISLMLITQRELIEALHVGQGEVAAGRDVVMTLAFKSLQAPQEGEALGAVFSAIVQIPNPQGWHARPASALGNLVRQYQARLTVRKGEHSASATSVVQLMALDTRCGDSVELGAQGKQAEVLLAAAVDAIRNGLGESIHPYSVAKAAFAYDEEPPLLGARSAQETLLQGVKAAPGIGWGAAQVLIDITQPDDSPVLDTTAEKQRLDRAIAAAKAGLHELTTQGGEAGEIFSAQLGLLDDPELQPLCHAMITAGSNAEQALFNTMEQQILTLRQLDNALLAGRAADLCDIRQRVLLILRDKPQDLASLPQGSVIVVKELVPSLAAGLNSEKVQAVVAAEGGAFSHAAIIARAKGIPAVFGVGPDALKIVNGVLLLVQADEGTVEIAPQPARLESLSQELRDRQQRKAQAAVLAHESARTCDGFHIEIAANIANAAEAVQAVEQGADGVGLLRSEFLFLDRPAAPDEEEQYQTYLKIMQALEGRPLIIRTLDVGGDKPLSYLPLPKEDNPFLGERGVRVGIRRPALLRQQLRALLRASVSGPLKIMLPMISTLEEYRMIRAFAQSIADELGVPLCPLGVMIEVPAAAIQADLLAQEADFFSIGSNDLTQYVVAVDRGHAGLSYLADPLHPAVLRLMAQTAKEGREHGIWVGLCGGLAGDPDATPLLIGMGLNELSVSAPVVGEIKHRVRELDAECCRELLQDCLAAATASDVRDKLRRFGASQGQTPQAVEGATIDSGPSRGTSHE
ncbi:MAG: phosphoenolpyruvate--protein phosphotransferase [Gammaproteobacteria bacterium]|nr:phosphoenolpyruvate--protein phosphotransferase [Gammaproteobacteria bacterium]